MYSEVYFFLEHLKYWMGFSHVNLYCLLLQLFCLLRHLDESLINRTTGTMTIEVSCGCIKADERNQSIFTKDFELDIYCRSLQQMIE